jgi:uncharacterized protein (DUF2267 family)
MTTTTRVAAFDRSVEKAYEWVDQLSYELGTPGERHYSYQVLRAVLHTLRDRRPVDAAVHLDAQLSPLVRGVYYENWRPTATPRTYHRAVDSLDLVAALAHLTGETQASFAVAATCRLLRRHLTPGELTHVRAALPADISDLFDGGPLP